LLLDGHHIYSPVVHGHPLVRYGLSADWSFWQRFDRPHLERCDEVVVLTLDGWRESIGVQAELKHAGVLGKPVRYLDVESSPITEPGRDTAIEHRGLSCLACGSDRLRVVYTRGRNGGVVQRRRECRDCKQRATTWERVVPSGG
jgi:hypothetical protein